jgi:hypothetical protein
MAEKPPCERAPIRVHVHPAQPLGMTRAGQPARDPAVEVEARLLERGELVAGRRAAGESIDSARK